MPWSAAIQGPLAGDYLEPRRCKAPQDPLPWLTYAFAIVAVCGACGVEAEKLLRKCGGVKGRALLPSSEGRQVLEVVGRGREEGRIQA